MMVEQQKTGNTKRRGLIIALVMVVVIGLSIFKFYNPFHTQFEPNEKYGSHHEWMNARYPAKLFFSGSRAEMGEAIYQNNLNKVKQLLTQKNFDVNALSPQGDGMTYLMYSTYLNNRFEIFRALLESGANPNLISKYYLPKYQAKGISGPDFSGNYERYPLPLAARALNIDYMRLLLEHGANPELFTKSIYNDKGNIAITGQSSSLEEAVSSDYVSDPEWFTKGKRFLDEMGLDSLNRVKLLQQYHVNLNSPNVARPGAVLERAYFKSINLVGYLLDQGVKMPESLRIKMIRWIKNDIAVEATNTNENRPKSYYTDRKKLLARLEKMKGV